MLNLSLGDVMFVSIKNYICKNFVCRMCVRWWVYVSETRFCFSCEVLPVCFVVVSVGLWFCCNLKFVLVLIVVSIGR